MIEPAVHGDSRGYFMETYNQRDFAEAGLNMTFVQDNQSLSSRGVLRGLHFQKQHPQGELAPAVKAAAKENPNIHFMGFQPVQKVWQELRTCEAMVLCSELYESFPMTIIEAMATGTPVLCADIGNHASIVKENGCGLLYRNRDDADFLSADGQGDRAGFYAPDF